jgi:hypothetical protein
MGIFEDFLNVIVWGIIAFIFVITADAIFLDSILRKGVVIDKQYKAESTLMGTGTGVGSNGQVTTVVMTETDSEKFLLIVRDKEDEIITVECEPQLYYEKEEKEELEFEVYTGKILGIEWGNKGLK